MLSNTPIVWCALHWQGSVIETSLRGPLVPHMPGCVECRGRSSEHTAHWHAYHFACCVTDLLVSHELLWHRQVMQTSSHVMCPWATCLYWSLSVCHAIHSSCPTGLYMTSLGVITSCSNAAGAVQNHRASSRQADTRARLACSA